MIATIVVVVVLLPLAALLRMLEPKQQFDEVAFDTPSWCDGSLTITPQNHKNLLLRKSSMYPLFSSVVSPLLLKRSPSMTPMYDVPAVQLMAMKPSTMMR